MLDFVRGPPDISQNNMMFSSIKNNRIFIIGNEGSAIPTAVTPAKNGSVIVKHRVGTFSLTELDKDIEPNTVID